jgi:hypothetical protein
MNISDLLTILAILTAPIIALQIQKYIEDRKEIRERKMQIFRTLMATRATRLDVKHIEALNMIDIEFFKNKKITEAWKLLLDNFANYPQNSNEENYKSKLSSCTEKSDVLFVDLLSEIAKSLDYKFDKVHLKRNIYIPKGQANIIMDQEFMRHAFVEVLLGKRSIPIEISNVTREDTEEGMKKLKQALTKKHRV